MRAVVVGAGLGGLATALRLQGEGHEVTVLEAREKPGGRAYQLRDGGYTWDMGPSLVTMPWVLEETFAAGGLDYHREVEQVELDPFYRIHWAQDERHLDLVRDRDRMREEIARFSSRDAAAFEGFLAALRPIYEEGILGAGRRAFAGPMDLARFTPRMVRLGAAQPLFRMVSKHLEHPRIREAMSFHSLFIGGDPYRVPAIYAALVYLQFLDGVHYTKGGVGSIVDAMARTLDVRTGERVVRVQRDRGRVTGVSTEAGTHVPADVVVWNADAQRVAEVLGERRPRRPMRSTMSALLLYLGTDRPFPQLHHHTLLVGDGYREFIKAVTGRRPTLGKTYSTYLHVPTRSEPGMGRAGGESICVLLPVPNLRGTVDWERDGDRVRDALVEDLETSFGLTGLDASIAVEHRMDPTHFARELGAVHGNAFATEPTLHQSASFRAPNRHPRARGLYLVGGGVHPGAGIPGVLLGAEVTAGLVAEDHPRPAGRLGTPAATGRR